MLHFYFVLNNFNAFITTNSSLTDCESDLFIFFSQFFSIFVLIFRLFFFLFNFSPLLDVRLKVFYNQVYLKHLGKLLTALTNLENVLYKIKN